MKSIFKSIVIFILSPLVFACSEETVTISSLLKEMPKKLELTYYPEKEYKLKQSSSYNRKTVGIDKEGWYENSDMSHFIRVEENQGRREFVMFDQDGPGTIVRWWMTFWRAQNGILRIYMDNDTIPEIEGAPFDVISGQLLAPEPLSQSLPAEAPIEERGHNLYLPIPYSKHCKVTYECDSLRPKEHYYWPDVFYNICYREYDTDVMVESFSLESLQEAEEELSHTNRKLLEDFSSTGIARSFDQELKPGDSVILFFDGEQNAIDFLSLQLISDDPDQALRSTVISASFDSQQSIWVPVGEFFGTGFQMNPHKTFANQTDKSAMMISSWIMPFKELCKVY